MDNVAIVGAGLVGSLWAVLLRRAGLNVTVFERRSDPRRASADGGRSINLVVTSRGIEGLRRAGLLERVVDLAVPVYGRMIHSKTGELAYQPYGQARECNLSVSRSALNQFLIAEAEAAGARFHFQHELEDLDPLGKTLVFQTSVGRRDASYGVLFGADGAGSRVRKALIKKLPAEFRDDVQWLEADYKELTLPLDPEGKPALRGDVLHIWPRGAHMMMALANRDGSFTVTLYLPKKGPVSFETVRDRDSFDRFFRDEFPDAVPLMPRRIDEFVSHPEGALGTVRTSKWVVGDSVALMGDAAHAIVPFFGQGMNAGFEDCSVLLDAWERARGEWAVALADYQKERKPNADAIADMALENWVEMKDKVGDAAFLRRKKIENLMEQKFPNLFKSRYGLITYTLTPYETARQAGLVQDRLFARLMEGRQSVEEIDWAQAESLLKSDWEPFMASAGVSLDVVSFERPGAF